MTEEISCKLANHYTAVQLQIHGLMIKIMITNRLYYIWMIYYICTFFVSHVKWPMAKMQYNMIEDSFVRYLFENLNFLQLNTNDNFFRFRNATHILCHI